MKMILTYAYGSNRPYAAQTIRLERALVSDAKAFYLPADESFNPESFADCMGINIIDIDPASIEKVRKAREARRDMFMLVYLGFYGQIATVPDN